MRGVSPPRRATNAPDRFSNRDAAIEQAARHLLAMHSFDAITVEQLVEMVGVGRTPIAGFI
ncbi:MAG: hypothetical protein WDO68_31050 [Gammaproteobacteria bacterium]